MTHTVPEELDGERLDRAVAILGDVSRSIARTIVDGGGVTVDGTITTGAKVRVRTGSVLVFEIPEVEERLKPHQVDYTTVDTSRPLDAVLSEFFHQRQSTLSGPSAARP